MAKNKLPTIISFILDRSGSMETIRDSVISGFNEYIGGLKASKDTSEALFSLTTFDTLSLDTPYSLAPIKTVKKLNKETFVPRGGTPLYDAAVKTIEALAERVGKKKQPVIVAIMTDGEENSSREHDQSCLKELIETLKGRGNWTFVFMGANQDSWSNASQLGFDKGNVMDFAFSDVGTKNAMRGMAEGTMAFCSMVAGGGGGGAMNSSNFFNANDAPTLTQTPKLSK